MDEDFKYNYTGSHADMPKKESFYIYFFYSDKDIYVPLK